MVFSKTQFICLYIVLSNKLVYTAPRSWDGKKKRLIYKCLFRTTYVGNVKIVSRIQDESRQNLTPAAKYGRSISYTPSGIEDVWGQMKKVKYYSHERHQRKYLNGGYKKVLLIAAPDFRNRYGELRGIITTKNGRRNTFGFWKTRKMMRRVWIGH